MTGTYRSRAADQRVADEFSAGQDLMCSAQGCPHRWSVDAGSGKLCSWHAWSEPHRWPQITQERIDALADRALRKQREEVKQLPRSMSHAEKMQTLRNMIAACNEQAQTGRSDWAYRLIDWHKCGVRVSYLPLKMAHEVVVKQERRNPA